MTSRRYRHAPCQRDFLTSYSSATRHEWLNLFSSRHECFTSDSCLTRTRLVSCVLLTSLLSILKMYYRCSISRKADRIGSQSAASMIMLLCLIALVGLFLKWKSVTASRISRNTFWMHYLDAPYLQTPRQSKIVQRTSVDGTQFS